MRCSSRSLVPAALRCGSGCRRLLTDDDVTFYLLHSPLSCRPIFAQEIDISEAARARWEAPFAVLAHDIKVCGGGWVGGAVGVLWVGGCVLWV